MRIPHTIPKVVFRAYTRDLDEEALKKSYEGRLLRSEDPSWDLKLRPTLRDICFEHVTDEYVFYVKYVEELNRQKLAEYEKQKEQWQKDLANYIQRKKSFELKKFDLEIALARKLAMGEDPNDVDDDDEDAEDEKGNVIKSKNKINEPEYIPDTFADYVPIKGLLDQMWDEDRVQAVEDLDIDYIPFDIAVQTIPDDYYWERCALDRWPFLLDADDHGKKWRRLYMERSLYEAIEAYHPIDGDLQALTTLLNFVAPEIIELRLKNLIPMCFGTLRKPIEDKIPEADFQPTGSEEDEGFGDGEEDAQEITQKLALAEKEKAKQASKQASASPSPEPQPPQPTLEPLGEPDRASSSHLDFELILPHLPNLKVLSLVYELQNTGLDWEARFFQFTDADCLSLAKALTLCSSIETFELLRSHLNDEQCKTLIREGLIKLPHLKKLNLSYNRLGDKGARAVARLLSLEGSRAIHTIHTVLLARNKIHNRGGKALAWALTKNRHLTHMDLRCNRMGDPAGRDFGHSLAKNKSLLVLLLTANRLTADTAYVMNKMLCHNTTLKELDLGANDLQKKGGEHIALGIRSNKNILRVDVRLANIGLDFEYDVGTHLRKNRNRLSGQNSLVERDDTFPNETESGEWVEDKELSEPEWDSEEEDEEEEADEEEEEMELQVVKAA